MKLHNCMERSQPKQGVHSNFTVVSAQSHGAVCGSAARFSARDRLPSASAFTWQRAGRASARRLKHSGRWLRRQQMGEFPPLLGAEAG